MSIQIRRGGAGDEAFIAESNCRMALETEKLALDPGTVARGVRAALADPAKGLYFIALVGDRPVGQLMVTFEWSDWRNGNLWWIQSVYVLPEFRRQGVFTELYRHVQQLAASSRAAGLRLYVEANNSNAQQTYQRLGMRLSHYRIMEQMLAAPLPPHSL